MTSILFVCLGNICRSTMAQSVMTHLLTQQRREDILVDSAGTSDEEAGNPVHFGTRRKLQQMGVPCIPHRARQLTGQDGERFDLLIGMETANLRAMRRLLPQVPPERMCRLLDFTATPRDIADPWYTGNFDETYEDILEGCAALLETLRHGGIVRP